MGFGDALVYVKQPVDEVRLSSMRWRGTRCAVLLGATLAIGATGGSQTLSSFSGAFYSQP